MSLNSLILCSDQKVMRVLRRVLSDLEIGIEDCGDADSAMRRITRRRFEAVIVDCSDIQIATRVLTGVRSAPANKRAIALAIIDRQQAVRNAFAMGANLVLYKPLTFDRARSSFRAARALMRCERRRNARVPVQIPVTLVTGKRRQEIFTTDISEGGVAVRLTPGTRLNQGPADVQFVLPGTDHQISCGAEVAWKSVGPETGIRFAGLARRDREHLRSWLRQNSSDVEGEDPPISCRLSDLSLAACYLEMPAPLPCGTRVTLIMHASGRRYLVEGIVRVMHPETGMGLELVRATDEERNQIKVFLQTLRKQVERPEFSVEPEGMDEGSSEKANPEAEDPLLELLLRAGDMDREAFRDELVKQRTPSKAKAVSV